MVGNHQLFQDGSRTPGKDGNIRAPGKLQDLEHVDDGMVESDVACGGHKAEDLEGLGRGQHHHDGRGLILSGVGSNDNLGWHKNILSKRRIPPCHAAETALSMALPLIKVQ